MEEKAGKIKTVILKTHMAKDWKDRLGVVYSTNQDYRYEKSDGEEAITPPPQQQDLRVSLDRKNRKGKAVTLVTGFAGSEADLKDLGKYLKSRCGVGGTVKDGEIIIQGDFCQRVMDLLIEQKYRVKRSGG